MPILDQVASFERRGFNLPGLVEANFSSVTHGHPVTDNRNTNPADYADLLQQTNRFVETLVTRQT